ncbi:Hint domain-containing protein [Brevirhabdus sp.]|uniref:Hint domain-containing protein n=1 Tax=Brevirhabdus sp. TaxID=2004514 RepID=UPI004058F1B9
MSAISEHDPALLAGLSFSGGLMAGAQVRTPCGARRIELLRVDDLVVTRSNGLQPVRMIWKRQLDTDLLAARPDLAPVRLKPRAVGPMMPQRDLVLAPNHKVLIPGYRLHDVADTGNALMSAAALAESSDAAYVDRTVDGAEFYHLVFDTPQVFCVNGLPVESASLSAASLDAMDSQLKERIWQTFPQLQREPEAYPPLEYPTVGSETYRPAA